MSFIALHELVDQMERSAVVESRDLETWLKSLPAYCEVR